MNEYEY